MSGESVSAWDSVVLLGGEATLGTTPNPATAQSFETISCDTGMVEVGEVRGKKDRNIGRGMQGAFVEGRVKPIAWNIQASVKSRAAATTVPQESVLYKAAGLTQTVGGANVVYSTPATPIETANSFASCSIYRVFGHAALAYEAEQLRGGVVKTLSWTGGDSELMLKAGGDAIGKYHLGYSSSITLADGVGTSLVFADAEEGYRFGLGWYSCESEIIKITAMNYSTFTATISRAQLSSSGVAHSAKALVPYVPTITYAGSPISEGGTVTVTVGGVTLRAMSFGIDLTTGMDLLPGESGSKYIQGVKALRYDMKATTKLVLSREQVALLGKATQRQTVAVSIIQSTGTAGGIVTFSLPYCEVEPFKVPDTANDVAIVDVSFRVRDNSGNDAFTLTLT